MARKYEHKKNGDFAPLYSEPMSRKVIGVRLPISLESELRQVAGDDISGWIRRAIATQLKQERKVSS